MPAATKRLELCDATRQHRRARHVGSAIVGEFGRAALGLAVVLLLPGVLVLTTLRVRLTVAECLALVPACSLGIVFVLAEVLTLVGVPFGPPAFAALTLGLAAVAAVRVRLDWHGARLDRLLAGFRDGIGATGLVSVALVAGAM